MGLRFCINTCIYSFDINLDCRGSRIAHLINNFVVFSLESWFDLAGTCESVPFPSLQYSKKRKKKK